MLWQDLGLFLELHELLKKKNRVTNVQKGEIVCYYDVPLIVNYRLGTIAPVG